MLQCGERPLPADRRDMRSCDPPTAETWEAQQRGCHFGGGAWDQSGTLERPLLRREIHQGLVEPYHKKAMVNKESQSLRFYSKSDPKPKASR